MSRPEHLNRRQLLVRGGQYGGLVTLSGLLAACGGGGGDGPGLPTVASDTTAPAGAGEIIAGVPGPAAYSGGRAGGLVTVAWNEGPNSLDPQLGYNPTAWDAITQLVYAPLYAFGGQAGGPVPNAAADVPQISDDKLTLTIALRPGVVFHNGREVTAEDYKWSWERLLDPETASWAASYLGSIAGAGAMMKGKARTLRGVTAVDDHTLRIELSKPDALILDVLSEPYTAPLPREEIERLGDRFGREPVGSGPFRIERYDDRGQTARFTRNDDYFWSELPYVDAVEYRWGVGPDTQLQQLKAGDVQLLGLGIPASLVPAARTDPALRENTTIIPQLAVRYVVLNLEREPLDDVRVRQALNWAIDRDALQKITYGESTAWGAPFPEAISGEAVSGYGYDPERARRLLADAGVADGFSMTLSTTNDDPAPKLAQVVQSQLAEIGVDLRLKQTSTNAQNDLLARNDVDMALTHWYFVQPTPADVVDGLYVTGASGNYQGYSNEELDRIAAEARQTFDDDVRADLYASVEQILVDDAPNIYLSTFNMVAARTPSVQNLQYRGEYGIYYDRLWLDS